MQLHTPLSPSPSPNLSPLQEITKHNYRDVLKMVPMFKDANEDFLSAIVSVFTYEVFLEEDLIISAHTRGTTMYFIQHGEAQVINCENEVIGILKDGDYFGGKDSRVKGGV